MTFRCAMWTCRRVLLVILLLRTLDDSTATIDNATGAVRENALPGGEVPAVVIDQTTVTSIATTDSSATIGSSSAKGEATTTSPISTASVAIGTTTTTTTTTTKSVPPTEVDPVEPTHQPLVPSSTTGTQRDELPPNCSEFSPSRLQLVYSDKARIRKCCPPGQMIQPRNNSQFDCVPGNRELQIETVEAQFYGNNECIEVSGEPVVLPVESEDLCEGEPSALMYSADQGDELFVLQNGSLLVLEVGSLVSVFESYCVEMTSDAQLLAKVCNDGRISRIGLGEFFMLLGMLLSVLTLLFTALCYSFVSKLKDTFGYLIAVHAGTFAVGTIFFGLARCGGRCINPANVAVTEMLSNALLGSSIFAFFLMNVYNTMYVAYYIPNGLEYENKNKRDMYAFLAVLYCITLIPLFLFPKGGLVCMVFLYLGAIAISHALSTYYTRRLTSGIYLQLSGQTKINQSRLNDISSQRLLCLLEALCAIVVWIVLAVLILTTNMAGAARIGALYCVVLQGLFIGVLFVAGQQRWIILRECWSNSGSVDLRAVESGFEMKTIKTQLVPDAAADKDDPAAGLYFPFLEHAQMARTVWPLTVVVVAVVCDVVLVPPVASALEASGQGESTYEEYDDESPYRGAYELPEEDFESLEDFSVPYDEVLDPITDDDISYSGYEYEEPTLVEDDDGAGGASSISSKVVTVVPPQQQAIPIGTGIDKDESRNGSTMFDAAQSSPLPGHDNVTVTSTSPPEDEDEFSCRGREKLPTQPTFVSRDVSVIRKCCPPGEILKSEHTKYMSCQKDARSATLPPPIVARFYRGCIEDLEEDIRLEVQYGSPCPIEGFLVSFGEHTNDTLYVIQNGSLLVIYGPEVDYDVYDTYCLDHDGVNGTLVGYVCPSAVRVMPDVIKGQLFMFAISLILAVPVLLVTAALYMIVPALHDLHGRALAMNCVNFAIALMLECCFQFRNRGKRMLVDDMVLENYAEYFILATFFWLLVNCGNHCFHTWYSVPRAKTFNKQREDVRFVLYALVAQFIPLAIILAYSTTPSGLPAFKHYLFIPIGVTLVLGLIFLLATAAGLRQLKRSYYDRFLIRCRLLEAKREDELCNYPAVSMIKINKVIYMFKYTIPLYCVMAVVWNIMAVTYYTTHELPIVYDILFAFQGILMFVVFVCMPRPWRAIRSYFISNDYCTCMFYPTAIESECKEQQVGLPTMVPLSRYEYEEPTLVEDDDGAGGASSDSSKVVTVVPPQQQAIPISIDIDKDESRNGSTEQHLTMPDAAQSSPLPGHDIVSVSSTSPPVDEDEFSCRDREKLPTQPAFVSRDVSVIRKCCPPGDSLKSEHTKYVSCQKDARSATLPRPIVARFYRDCIVDLEEDIRLEVQYGSPCPIEGFLVSFGERTNDTLYVIQNGSLLVIYGPKLGYDVYDTYCLDHDGVNGTLVGYVCPLAVRVMPDLIKGQLFLFAISLVLAVPVLLVTAALYMIVPALHDLHGRALAINCINFTFALVLECCFQFLNRGERMLLDDMVLKNYAEYFILATFFWLLVNCVNNCYHTWYSVPRGKTFNKQEENVRTVWYALVAQVIPLTIIGAYSTTPSGLPAFKHYLFIPIGVTLVLGLIFLLATAAGLRQLKRSHYDRLMVRCRLMQENRPSELCNYPAVSMIKINKVIYMFTYTVPLFCVVAVIWCIMAVTYYKTHELPIYFDILFALQGILMFVVFVCMPRPWRAIRSYPDPENEAECRAQHTGSLEMVPLSRSVSHVAAPMKPCAVKQNLNPFRYLETRCG
uniref:Cyclic nucleotide-binding domain-containing protein n=1 Tax=Anopheles dirus TaxID=7168 RepID=A0A182MXK3_9DIPT